MAKLELPLQTRPLARKPAANKLAQALALLLAWVLASGVVLAQKAGTATFTGSATVGDWVKFTTVGSLGIARQGHSVTVLPNGKVLAAGGTTPGQGSPTVASAEIYDPAVGEWSATGNMTVPRTLHHALLLGNGKVLVLGGINGPSPRLASAELYDPTSGSWSACGGLLQARTGHSATLLNDGKVLVAGGEVEQSTFTSSAELFDPSTCQSVTTGSMSTPRSPLTVLLADGRVLAAGGWNGTTNYPSAAEIYDPAGGVWSPTGNMVAARSSTSAVRLDSGKVLVAGGYDGARLASAELYDPASGRWAATGTLAVPRSNGSLKRLPDGSALMLGGSDDAGRVAVTERYDPATGVWTAIGNLNTPRDNNNSDNVAVLSDGKVLIAGGFASTYVASTELGTLIPSHTFTGSLILPSGWVASLPLDLQFSGSTDAAAVNAGSLSSDGINWGPWVSTAPGIQTPATWSPQEGSDRRIHLRLRDADGLTATVVTGSVNVDQGAPASVMTPLPSFSGSSVNLSWSASDALSGVASYDLQARAESDVQWTNVLAGTTQLGYVFNGTDGTTYYFRVRARDNAGNLEPWREPYDTSTVGTDFGVSINNGALFTNSTTVNLMIAARPGTSQMQVSNDGGFAGASWEPYASQKAWQITQFGSYVIPRVVYVRYRDSLNNVSATFQDDIILDVTAPAGGISAVSTAGQPGYVASLSLYASDDLSGVSSMMLTSNPDASPGNWEPYSATRVWTFDAGGRVYLRYRDNAGNVSPIYSYSYIGSIPGVVNHYYQHILGRAADPGGLAFWSGEVERLRAAGADPAEALIAMAMAFFNSGEYSALPRNDSSFVTDLYRTFFNRLPDADGLAYWVANLVSGMPREVLLAQFMFSPEFTAFTQAIFGSTVVRAEVGAVTDFYRGILGRLPDDGGFAYWIGRFRTAQCQGPTPIIAEVEAISSAFALSGEYAARARNNAQYVGDLYNAFLRRGGELGGVQFWIDQVATGARTREQARVEFRNSPEFQARVNAIIAQGCLLPR